MTAGNGGGANRSGASGASANGASANGGGYDWAAIKSRVDIVQVVQTRLPLKRKGNIWQACCPFHNEKSPSFTVYPGDGFHCFGCGAHGDAVDFIRAIDNCSVSEAIERIGAGDVRLGTLSPAERASMDAAITQRQQEADEIAQAATALARRRWAACGPATEANAYLARKGILPHMARTDSGDLLVPVYDADGELQSVQSISGDGSKLFQPGAPMRDGRCNFGIAIRRTIVCEGFATGASLFEALHDRVTVAFSLGNMRNIIRELHASGAEVVIAADRKGVTDMCALGDELGIPVFVPDAPHDDFNDLAQADGKAAIVAVFAGPAFCGTGSCGAGDDASAPDASITTEIPPTSENTDPVDVWARNEPPSLPAGLLPPIIERFAVTRARMLGGDPGGLAMAALSVCGAVITDRIRLKVKQHENWTESARLWVMLIGDPSSKKSPLMRAAAGKISSMDSEMLRQHLRDLVQWQNDKSDGIDREKPEETRLRMEDITMEAAQEVCRYSPNGVLALQDELSGWFGGIEKYAGGKGSAKDRSFWLRAYNGGEYAVNRISRKSFLIDNLSISILGGIQPDALRKIMADSTDDGLIQRFLPVVLPPASLGVDEELPDVAREFDELVQALHGLVAPDSILGERPLVFDADAREIRAQLEREHHKQVIDLERVSKKFAAHIGKFDGLFPRLCVIWHCIENVNRALLPEVITGEIAGRVARFLREYIAGQSKAFYHGVIGVSEDQEAIEDVAGYILAHGVDTVTMRTFQRGSTRMRKFTKQAIEPVCQQLEALGWLDNIDVKSGRMTAKVNPRVHELFAEQAENERQIRAAMCQ